MLQSEARGSVRVSIRRRVGVEAARPIGPTIASGRSATQSENDCNRLACLR